MPLCRDKILLLLSRLPYDIVDLSKRPLGLMVPSELQWHSILYQVRAYATYSVVVY